MTTTSGLLLDISSSALGPDSACPTTSNPSSCSMSTSFLFFQISDDGNLEGDSVCIPCATKLGQETIEGQDALFELEVTIAAVSCVIGEVDVGELGSGAIERCQDVLTSHGEVACVQSHLIAVVKQNPGIQPAVGAEFPAGDPLRIHGLDRDRDAGAQSERLSVLGEPPRVIPLPQIRGMDDQRGRAECLAHVGPPLDLLYRIEAPHRLGDDQ